MDVVVSFGLIFFRFFWYGRIIYSIRFDDSELCKQIGQNTKQERFSIFVIAKPIQNERTEARWEHKWGTAISASWSAKHSQNEALITTFNYSNVSICVTCVKRKSPLVGMTGISNWFWGRWTFAKQTQGMSRKCMQIRKHEGWEVFISRLTKLEHVTVNLRSIIYPIQKSWST
jgi:hypothetical protein